MPKKVGDGETCHSGIPDSSCKKCRKRIYMRTWVEKNRTLAREHNKKSQEKRRADKEKYAADLERAKIWRREHPDEQRKHGDAWAKAHPEKRRNSALRRNYKITLADYEQMLASQNGQCALCETNTPGGMGNVFHVDHDHATGKIRGLLCLVCNITLRHLEKKPAWREKVAMYLSQGQP